MVEIKIVVSVFLSYQGGNIFAMYDGTEFEDADYPIIWLFIARFMDQDELKRLFFK